MKRSSHVACPRLRESMPPYTPLCVGASDARRLVDVKTTTTTKKQQQQQQIDGWRGRFINYELQINQSQSENNI